MRWIAVFSWRFPLRLSRCRAWLEDHTGSGAVPFVASVRACRAEAIDAGGFAQDLRGRERTAATDREQRWRELLDQRGDLVFEPPDLDRQLATAFDEFAGDPGDEPIASLQHLGEPLQATDASERARRPPRVQVELVQMPAKTVDHARSLLHQILTVVDQQTHITLTPVQSCRRQTRFP